MCYDVDTLLHLELPILRLRIAGILRECQVVTVSNVVFVLGLCASVAMYEQVRCEAHVGFAELLW